MFMSTCKVCARQPHSDPCIRPSRTCQRRPPRSRRRRRPRASAELPAAMGGAGRGMGAGVLAPRPPRTIPHARMQRSLRLQCVVVAPYLLLRFHGRPYFSGHASSCCEIVATMSVYSLRMFPVNGEGDIAHLPDRAWLRFEGSKWGLRPRGERGLLVGSACLQTAPKAAQLERWLHAVPTLLYCAKAVQTRAAIIKTTRRRTGPPVFRGPADGPLLEGIFGPRHQRAGGARGLGVWTPLCPRGAGTCALGSCVV